MAASAGQNLRIDADRLWDSLMEMAKIGPGVAGGNNRQTLTDADGKSHRMAGLLPLETSFAQRKMHLGYRNAVLSAGTPLGPIETVYGAHEFHYASTTRLGDARPLFTVSDAAGNDLGPAGLQAGSVFGSFIHLIDRR